LTYTAFCAASFSNELENEALVIRELYPV
jgi:hypothetical protein